MDEENYMLEEDLLLTKEVQSCKTFNVYLIVSIFCRAFAKFKGQMKIECISMILNLITV